MLRVSFFGKLSPSQVKNCLVEDFDLSMSVSDSGIVKGDNLGRSLVAPEFTFLFLQEIADCFDAHG
jgi:hypothetical protein